MKILKNPGIEQLERDIFVTNLVDSVKTNIEKINKFNDSLESIKILEELVDVGGERFVLFSTPGNDNGIAVAEKDIESGKISRENAYFALSEAVNIANNVNNVNNVNKPTGIENGTKRYK